VISRVVRAISSVAAAILLLASAAAASAQADRAQVAEALAIRSPAGIDEAQFISINGVDQWITIRGQDRSKPVVLVLHGGPGQAQSHLIQRMSSMEKDFIVVQWDQRGAGKTLAKAGGTVDPALDLATMVSDGLAVTDHLRRRLRRDRIVLLGFSWGSRLGVEMAQAKPQAFSAYVGTGQQGVGSQAQLDAWIYGHLLERAKAAADAKGLADLIAVGAPPWDAKAGQAAYRASAPFRAPDIPFAESARAALTAPNWELADAQALARGRGAYKGTQLEREIAAFEPSRFGLALDMPVIVIEGAEDLTTPAPFAEAWLRRLKAPRKAFVTIPDAGHQVLMTHNAAFTAALKQQLAALGVRGLATPAASSALRAPCAWPSS
jgi:pimeloyl-ACP methyl ester carboxylesterase